jgi:tetratricopeptide (TPR) repeat protein
MLLLQPDNPRYHYLMAGALAADNPADLQQAAEHYRRSLELDPNQPRCLADHGKLALRLGQTEEGLRSLRRAVQLAPDDPTVLMDLAEGLRQAGRNEEAGATLRAARFRNPRDRRFHQLWLNHQFKELHNAQQTARQDDAAIAEDEPVLLPFARAAATLVRHKLVRRDPASPTSPPHSSRVLAQGEQKHAQ